MAFNITDATTREAIQNLKKLEKYFSVKERKKMLGKAAKPLIKSAKSKVDSSDAPHKRYDSNGNHVATYYPGNLKRSIRILPLRRSQDIFVGPYTTKGSSQGDFRGNRVDGYYAHMVEGGTINYQAKPYMRPAAEESREEVNRNIADGASDIVKKYNRENARF